MFFTVNVIVIGCFSLLTLCYLDVFHCERYVIWMFFTVNVMLIGCCHCERYVLWMFLPVNVMIYRCFHCYGYKKRCRPIGDILLHKHD